MEHPNYPRLLPQAALLGPLSPYPIAMRNAITARLQAGRSVEITRGFLAICNLNLLQYASMSDLTYIQRELASSSSRQITSLSQSISLALRECRQNSFLQSTRELIWEYKWVALMFIDQALGGRHSTSNPSTRSGPSGRVAAWERSTQGTQRSTSMASMVGNSHPPEASATEGPIIRLAKETITSVS